MIIGNYTADVSVGETVPSPISPEPWCRKDTIRGGRVLDGGWGMECSEGFGASIRCRALLKGF